MITRILTALTFGLGAMLPFFAFGCWWKGWIKSAIVFGLLYIIIAAWMVISICVAAKQEEQD